MVLPVDRSPMLLQSFGIDAQPIAAVRAEIQPTATITILTLPNISMIHVVLICAGITTNQFV
jgi:hypothetical protein